MLVSFDPAKRERVLTKRGLDIARAPDVFAGFHLTRADPRHSEEERRVISVGTLDGDVVIVVWTHREGSRRIITMWKANEKERNAYGKERDRPR